MSKYKVLSDEQVQSFLDNGYLVVRDCVDLSVANRWIDEAYSRLGYDRNNPATWEKDIVWLDHKNFMPIREVAPKAWGALLDVIGGEERLETQTMRLAESGHFTTVNSLEWSDSFIVNFRRGADKPWQPPSKNVSGWHKDGSYFKHFLDSREQALLPIVLWSDMLHQGGGTFISPDSVKVMARYLFDRPQGVNAGDLDITEILSKCSRFEEVTGKAGDFFILHPFTVHASSQNVIGKPRFMTNPPVVLKEPLNFNRSNPDEFSLLERATLHYLGLDRLDFQPTSAREAAWSPV